MCAPCQRGHRLACRLRANSKRALLAGHYVPSEIWQALLDVSGGRGWDRTSDPCDVNAVLIPLSYAPVPRNVPLYRVAPGEGNPRSHRNPKPQAQAASSRST